MLNSEDVAFSLAQLPDDDLIALRHFTVWHGMRREAQTEPPGDDWTIWFFRCGRGGGKTRSAAEWVFENAWMSPGSRWLVLAPTYGDLQGVCFDGESGLLAVIPRELIVPTKSGSMYDSTTMEIKLKNGSIIKGISADNPERLRGHQWHGVWADEFASVTPSDAEDILSNILFAMRLGKRPKMLITSTPKPTSAIRNLVKRSDVVQTTGSSYDNIHNLAPTFRRQLEQYEGTRLGQQEIHGVILNDDEESVIKRSWLKKWPAELPLPTFRFIIMSLDTAFTEEARDKKKNERDPTACTVWGVFQHRLPGSDIIKDGVMLLDAWDDYLGFPDLITRIKKEKEFKYGSPPKSELKPTFGPRFVTQHPEAGKGIDNIVIEEKGSGKSVIQQLAHEKIFARPYNPGRADKITRLHRVSHIFKDGMIWIPESKKTPDNFVKWAEKFIEQLCAYSGEGSTEHDDYVDTASQAITMLLDMKAFEQIHHKKTELEKQVEMEYEERRKRRGNPYA